MIVDIDLQTLDRYPPACFMHPDNAGYRMKRDWLEKRFAEGLKIKALVGESDGKMHGLVEYVPGEHAWRAVDAKGYMFIHCLWVHPRKWRNRGHGSALIQAVVDDAHGMLGVAVITSDGPFMASQEIFLKQGFVQIEEDGDYQLLARQFREGKLPAFREYRKQRQQYSGWHILYSNQCPWVSRFIHELDPALVERLNLTITELKTPQQAQDAPSLYSAFNLLHDGRLLADHYISMTRFSNILKKELQGR